MPRIGLTGHASRAVAGDGSRKARKDGVIRTCSARAYMLAAACPFGIPLHCLAARCEMCLQETATGLEQLEQEAKEGEAKQVRGSSSC